MLAVASSYFKYTGTLITCCLEAVISVLPARLLRSIRDPWRANRGKFSCGLCTCCVLKRFLSNINYCSDSNTVWADAYLRVV